MFIILFEMSTFSVGALRRIVICDIILHCGMHCLLEFHRSQVLAFQHGLAKAVLLKSFGERGIVKATIGTVAEDDDAENKAIVAAERGHRNRVP